MAQLVRCYFRQTGIPAEDVSFPTANAFELAIDLEFTSAEIALAGAFRIMVGVKNFNTNVVIIPAPAPVVLPAVVAPVHNTPAVIAGARNQTFVYTIPAGTGAAGQFLDAKTAVVIGAVGQDTDSGEASCVIVP